MSIVPLQRVVWSIEADQPVVMIDPATEEELGTVPEMGLDETKQAIEAASKAFKTWSKTSAKVCR